MTISLKPETKRLVEEEIENGHFQSVDDLIVKTVHAWREQHYRSRGASHREEAVDQALAFAQNRAISLDGISIHDLIHDGHRL